MSLQSVTASARRASAAIKAAPQHAVAKRGMFAMIEKTHRYTSLLHGAYAGYIGYRPCIVTKVTRDGIVKRGATGAWHDHHQARLGLHHGR